LAEKDCFEDGAAVVTQKIGSRESLALVVLDRVAYQNIGIDCNQRRFPASIMIARSISSRENDGVCEGK